MRSPAQLREDALYCFRHRHPRNTHGRAKQHLAIRIAILARDLRAAWWAVDNDSQMHYDRPERLTFEYQPDGSVKLRKCLTFTPSDWIGSDGGS